MLKVTAKEAGIEAYTRAQKAFASYRDRHGIDMCASVLEGTMREIIRTVARETGHTGLVVFDCMGMEYARLKSKAAHEAERGVKT